MNILEIGKKRFPLLFEPLNIGNISIPNRIWFPPFGVSWYTEEETISEKWKQFYFNLAESGCGLITVGCSVVSNDAIPSPSTMRLYEDKHVPGLKSLCDGIAARGSVPAIQITHFGRQCPTFFSGGPLKAASAIPCPLISQADPNYQVMEMTCEEIQTIVRQFIHSAELAVKAGFKIIQLHGAHGYLLTGFLSPHTNKRTDEYGGNVENRTRIFCEIIKGIKEKVGNKVSIDVRVSVEEYVDDGLKVDDFKEIIPYFENAGLDMISPSVMIYESMKSVFFAPLKPEARYAPIAAKIKKMTDLPIAHSFFIGSLDTAEKVRCDYDIDLVGLGRVQFADPFYISKTLLNKKDEVYKCIWCHKCLIDLMTPQFLRSYCSVNPNYLRPELNNI